MPVAGQSSDAGERPLIVRADLAVLHAVNGRNGAAWRYGFRTVDATAYPVFYGIIPAMWGGAFVANSASVKRAALNGTATYLTAAGAVYMLKNTLRRPRPYRTHDTVRMRSRAHDLELVEASYSLPSGHSTLAFALATTWSLSARHPGVTAASYAWASGMAFSRVWLGVHYPTDILAGAALGIGVGYTARVLTDWLLPDLWQPHDGRPSTAPFTFIIPIR